MNRVQAQLLKKISAVFSILLLCFCVLFPFASLQAEADNNSPAGFEYSLDQDQNDGLHLFAGEVSSGEPEAVLQIFKSNFLPLFKACLQVLFSDSNTLVAAPIDFQDSKGDCGLHTILTKGP